MSKIPVFWLEETDQTRERVVTCDCGEPDCRINGTRSQEPLYRRSDTGGLVTLREAPVGALWDATWYDRRPDFTGADGISLVVRTPGGVWHVDSEASNCTRPGDRSHKCWVRHGDPRDPQGLRNGQPLHVDKQGETCATGAGSIIAGSYHGFLHHGHLVST